MAAYMTASLEAEQTANMRSGYDLVHALDETCRSILPSLEPSGRRGMVLMNLLMMPVVVVVPMVVMVVMVLIVVLMMAMMHLFARVKWGIRVSHLDLLAVKVSFAGHYKTRCVPCGIRQGDK